MDTVLYKEPIEEFDLTEIDLEEVNENGFEKGGLIKYEIKSEPKFFTENTKKKIFKSKIPKKLGEIEILYEKSKEFESIKILDSATSVRIFKDYWNKNIIELQESFWVLFLNKANYVLAIHNVSKGGITGTVVDAEIITGIAIKTLSKAIIIAHNHPSGNLKPSQTDIVMTKQLGQALKLFDIQLLDSIIITKDSYLSMTDEGTLPEFYVSLEKGGEIEKHLKEKLINDRIKSLKIIEKRKKGKEKIKIKNRIKSLEIIQKRAIKRDEGISNLERKKQGLKEAKESGDKQWIKDAEQALKIAEKLVEKKMPSISEIKDNGILIETYPVDESQEVSNAGDARLYEYKGNRYEIIRWMDDAKEHEEGEETIRKMAKGGEVEKWTYHIFEDGKWKKATKKDYKEWYDEFGSTVMDEYGKTHKKGDIPFNEVEYVYNPQEHSIAYKTKTMAKGGEIKSDNPLIADNYFKQNPSKVLGDQEIKKGRYGQDVIVVKGELSDINKIEVFTPNVQREEISDVTTDKSKDEIIEKTVETSYVKTAKKAVKPPKTKQITIEKGKLIAYPNQEINSIRETAKKYNEDITQEEIEAYFFTNPELPYENLLDKKPENQKLYLENGLIAYIKGKFEYVYIYKSGNINEKITILNSPDEKEEIIDKFGEKQWEMQLKILEDTKDKEIKFLSFIGEEENRIKLLPHSIFAKEIEITELRYEKPELYGKTSLFNAYKAWLRQIPADEFKKSTYREIIEFYLDNKRLAINKKATKEDQERQKKNAISIRQRAKHDGDRLFDKFLAEELTSDDQSIIAKRWNEKYNSLVEPNFEKIPVGFRISKTFKGDIPFDLSKIQRRAVAFIMVKQSGLLAYGVGVGKTASAIAYISQAIDYKLSKKPLLIVPTNTYDKWLGELQGYVDKDNGLFMKGLLPHLPPVVGLHNLNPKLVRNEFKIYTDNEKEELEKLEKVYEALTKLPANYRFDNTEKNIAIHKIYPVNFEGLIENYSNYITGYKGKEPKTILEYFLKFIKTNLEHKIYSLGKLKDFPKHTIFVTTEQGLQRLGLNEDNKNLLAGRFYEILSQGEKSGGRERERERAILEIKIDQMISSSLKKAKINIEDFEIDLTVFDESHFYKKIFTYLKGEIKKDEYNLKGREKREKSKYELKSGQYPSNRALSAFVISQYIQSANNNRNVVHLTATPFTNRIGLN